LEAELGTSKKSTSVGTPDSMSPERLSGGKTDGKSDVYGFGILLWSMFTEEIPFKNKNQPWIMRAVLKGDRPPWTSGAPENLKALVNRCWAQNVEERLSSQELWDALCKDPAIFPGADLKILASEIQCCK
jgi:serine/threonine protein kinase